MQRVMTKGGRHLYSLALRAGDIVQLAVEQRGFDIDINVYSPTAALTFAVTSGSDRQGRELVPLEARSTGVYLIELSEQTGATGSYTIEASFLDRSRFAARADSIRDWLRRNAIVLRGVAPGTGLADLAPLRDVLRGVRVVGLGESTHGTREYRQFAHRLFEYLATELGFRIFAIESSYSGGVAIDAYVVHGIGDPAELLAGQGYWITNTDEVLDLIRWMRRYNETVPDAGKLHFVGIDMLQNAAGVEALRQYFRTVWPAAVAPLDSAYATVSGWVSTPDRVVRPDSAAWRRVGRQFEALLGFLTVHEEALVRLGGRTAYDGARWHARILAQFADASGPTPSPSSGDDMARDAYLADNLTRVMRDMGPDARAVVLAHDTHVSGIADLAHTTPDDWTLGRHLRTTFGNAYYVLGMHTNRGAFQARNVGVRRGGPIEEHSVPAAPIGTGEWYLDTGLPQYLIDFRSTSKPELIGRWLAAPQPVRFTGAGYKPGPSPSWPGWFTAWEIGMRYDGIVFIDHTTRAQPSAVPTRR